MHDTRRPILQLYGVPSADLIRKGMEAEVYAMDSDRVLKLYFNTTSLAELAVLRDFYASLDASTISYALPFIEKVAVEGETSISIERRLPGEPMGVLLPTLSSVNVERMMQVYLEAVLELRQVRIPQNFTRYKLFDQPGLSSRSDGDWHLFLNRLLEYKLVQVRGYLEKDVHDLAQKLQRLSAVLDAPYTGEFSLVHGDFFPGNLHLDGVGKPVALLDFGLWTMYGDAHFDLATAWVFFDMYDQLKLGLRQRLLDLIIARLGEGVRGKLYRYVLIYSIIAANAYSPTCSDGQYLWCVDNLNNAEYWKRVV